MKLIIVLIVAILTLSFASASLLAYSGCELDAEIISDLQSQSNFNKFILEVIAKNDLCAIEEGALLQIIFFGSEKELLNESYFKILHQSGEVMGLNGVLETEQYVLDFEKHSFANRITNISRMSCSLDEDCKTFSSNNICADEVCMIKSAVQKKGAFSKFKYFFVDVLKKIRFFP